MSRRGHCLYFFLTPAEQVALLEEFEARHQVAYYRADTSAVSDAPAIASLVSEEALGYLSTGDWNHSPSYLLTFPEEGVVVEEIILRKGVLCVCREPGKKSCARVPATRWRVYRRRASGGVGGDVLAQFLF